MTSPTFRDGLWLLADRLRAARADARALLNRATSYQRVIAAAAYIDVATALERIEAALETLDKETRS